MNELLLMLQAADPLFPVGGYTLSNGLETYARMETVKDAESLLAYLKAYVSILPYNDLAFAHRAFSGYDITELDALVSALKAPYEIRKGSMKQCARFLKAQKTLREYPLLSDYEKKINAGECDGHYSVAMGLFIKSSGMDIDTGLLIYGYSILSSIVNHALKLAPIGQLDGQRTLYDTMPLLLRAAEKAKSCRDDELGASGCGFDIRSMQHENLYSRLYIS